MAKGDFTKAKEISTKTKMNVLYRQKFKSLSGASLQNCTVDFHHFQERSSSGVGYEWNIIAMTRDEHRAIHDHKPIKRNGKDLYTYNEFQTLMHNHLVLNYLGWSVKKCKYHKGWEEKDYEVTSCYQRQ